MAIARFPSFVLDCPDPGVLARFYGELLGWEVRVDDDGSWGEVRGEGQCICFQQVASYAAPDWPGQDRPQQVHLDVVVEDMDAAETAVLAIGATRHAHQPGESFRVFLDPAGHPPLRLLGRVDQLSAVASVVLRSASQGGGGRRCASIDDRRQRGGVPAGRRAAGHGVDQRALVVPGTDLTPSSLVGAGMMDG